MKRRFKPVRGLKLKVVESKRGDMSSYGEVIDWGRARIKRVKKKKAAKKTKAKE